VSERLVAADRRARVAFRDLEDQASAHVEAIAALNALLAVVRDELPNSLLGLVLKDFDKARREGLTRFWQSRVEGAVARAEARGDSDGALRALDDAALVFSALEGNDSARVRALREQRAQLQAGQGAKPRPFLARYLEGQKR
jgi:hypothetical protein